MGTALVNDPELLILDEPTTGIDPAGRRELWRLIEGLAADGTTILLTTHYMEEAETLADRVGLLAAGELVAIDSPSELIARHGGDSRLVVEVDEHVRASDVLTAAGYEPLANERHLAVSAGPKEIPPIVEALEDAEIDYDGLVWRQPSLEDVYVSLTDSAIAVEDLQ